MSSHLDGGKPMGRVGFYQETNIPLISCYITSN
jgi:hypothetical protein